jgi:hypothetical protein
VKLAAAIGIAEQDLVRRMISLGLRTWEVEGRDLRKLFAARYPGQGQQFMLVEQGKKDPDPPDGKREAG